MDVGSCEVIALWVIQTLQHPPSGIPGQISQKAGVSDRQRLLFSRRFLHVRLPDDSTLMGELEAVDTSSAHGIVKVSIKNYGCLSLLYIRRALLTVFVLPESACRAECSLCPLTIQFHDEPESETGERDKVSGTDLSNSSPPMQLDQLEPYTESRIWSELSTSTGFDVASKLLDFIQHTLDTCSYWSQSSLELLSPALDVLLGASMPFGVQLSPLSTHLNPNDGKTHDQGAGLSLPVLQWCWEEKLQAVINPRSDKIDKVNLNGKLLCVMDNVWGEVHAPIVNQHRLEKVLLDNGVEMKSGGFLVPSTGCHEKLICTYSMDPPSFSQNSKFVIKPMNQNGRIALDLIMSMAWLERVTKNLDLLEVIVHFPKSVKISGIARRANGRQVSRNVVEPPVLVQGNSLQWNLGSSWSVSHDIVISENLQLEGPCFQVPLDSFAEIRFVCTSVSWSEVGIDIDNVSVDSRAFDGLIDVHRSFTGRVRFEEHSLY